MRIVTPSLSKKFALSFILSVGICLTMASTVHATQIHFGSEGLYAHQIAHAFFAFSMGILLYWLRDRKLMLQAGWRYVQYSAVFFILWNLNALAVHTLDNYNELFQRINAGDWWESVPMDGECSCLALFYYVIKMDHLLCLPGIVLLYLGLRELLKRARKAGAPAE